MKRARATGGPRPGRQPGPDWPNREASRFVEAAGIHWHVQDMGTGPDLLLLHGTGAANHSWAGLAPLLAPSFRVIAPDLPGHGCTESLGDQGSSLPGMSGAIAQLLDAMELNPQLVVGHSAGSAVLARMCLDDTIEPTGLVSLNGALFPFGGLASPLFTRAARLLASLPALPHLVALQATPRRSVEQMIRQTGSRLSPGEVEHYRRLARAPRHVAATLRMMANWDLGSLARELRNLEPALYLVACANDLAVPPAQARKLAEQVPGARLQILPGLGHLGHEENPPLFAQLIQDIAAELAVIAAD